MRKDHFIICALALSLLCPFQGTAQQKGLPPSESDIAKSESTVVTSESIVRSEISRNPSAAHIDGLQGRLKWNYTTGLELYAFLDVYEKTHDKSILDYVQTWFDSIIDEDGNISTYKASNYSTDHVCPARTLLKLASLCDSEKYQKAVKVVRNQLDSQPRTSEGGFWHKAVYPHQMWLDGIYMAQPFYAEYTALSDAPQQYKDSIYRDICSHFLIVARHTFDPATKLYRHAWDESRSMRWADKTTGQSQHAWGRALGWYCMAVVETMPLIPDGTPGKKDVLRIFRDIAKVLPRYADPESGMWYQVLDRPGAEGNYLEATASAMFCYSLLKGTRLGYLPRKTLSYARDTYSKLLRQFVTTDADGLVQLGSCCAVAGLGGKDNRMGDYDYYIHEKVCVNDPKGIGPLIWAALEMENEEKPR